MPPSLCPTCNHSVGQGAKYCPSCGEKIFYRQKSIWFFLSDIFDSIFSLNSKLFLSFYHLMIPAKLTLEYFKGVRKKYYSPFRFFFVSLVVVLATIKLANQNKSTLELKLNGFENTETAFALYDLVDSAHYSFRQDQLLKEEAELINAYSQHIKSIVQADTNDMMDISNFIFDDRDSIMVPMRDAFGLPIDSLISRYHITGFWDQVFLEQTLKVMKQKEDLAQYIFGKLSWMFIILVPLLAFCSKLLYWRSRRWMVEHIVFLFHLCTFALLLVLLQELWSNALFVRVLLIIFLLYFLFALKRFYGQTWPMTIFKMLLLIVCFSILGGILIVLTGLLSFLLF